MERQGTQPDGILADNLRHPSNVGASSDRIDAVFCGYGAESPLMRDVKGDASQEGRSSKQAKCVPVIVHAPILLGRRILLGVFFPMLGVFWPCWLWIIYADLSRLDISQFLVHPYAVLVVLPSIVVPYLLVQFGVSTSAIAAALSLTTIRWRREAVSCIAGLITVAPFLVISGSAWDIALSETFRASVFR
jgi:hypothetical protein